MNDTVHLVEIREALDDDEGDLCANICRDRAPLLPDGIQ